MNARQAALAHYGGTPPRCAWCGTKTGPFELDHLGGGGNAHRRAIGTKLEYWLKAQGYPAGYQVLCRHCHDGKSGRMPAMKGERKKVLHVEIDAGLYAQLELAAAGSSKRQVVEAMISTALSGNAAEALTSTLHARLDAISAQLASLEAASPAAPAPVEPELLRQILDALKAVERRQAALEAQYQKQIFETLGAIYDELKGKTNGQGKRRLFSW